MCAQVMPNITIDKLERFVQALIESRARASCRITTELADFARQTEADLLHPASPFGNGAEQRTDSSAPLSNGGGSAHQAGSQAANGNGHHQPGQPPQ